MNSKQLVSFPELINYVWDKRWNMCAVVNEDKDKPVKVTFTEFGGFSIEGCVVFEEDRFDLNKIEDV